MTTLKKASFRRWVIVLVVSAIMLLLLTWHFAGFEPDRVISLSGVHPLAVTTDGATLIVGTLGEWNIGIATHVVGEIRFLDLVTGKDTQAPLALKERKTFESWQAGFEHSATTISDVKLSDDGQRLAVVQTGLGEAIGNHTFYFLTVFDLATRAVILEKDIPWVYDPSGIPVVQLSHDGRLLACVSLEPDRSVIVWDLNEGNERFRLRGRSRESSFQFSPDGKLLATLGKSGQFDLANTATGALVHSIALGNWSLVYMPTFSPDSKFVAIDNWQRGEIRVFDTASGKLCFQQSKSCWPQFLPGGSLLAIGNSGPGKVEPAYFFIPEIVIWSPDGWTEKRAFVYDLGASPLTGTVMPHPLPLGLANQFALTYETSGGWWTGSPKGSTVAGTGLGRVLGLNIPRGLGLDVVDAANGITKTYHLDSSGAWFPFPQAGKILIPKSDGTTAVWSIPPRRSYRAVAAMAGILAAIGVLGYALIFVLRRVVKLYRGRQETGLAQ
jgi:hypothetical protein